MSENNHVDPLEDTRAESIRPGKMAAGAPLGGYELQHVLGEGGMGVVWCAHDPLLDRTIALKVLKSRDVGAAMRTRLLREAQAMAQIKHPNVLTVHRVGTEGDRDFIVMELVDGGPLDHWLAFGPPEHEVMEALLAAGRGLAAAHAAGLVHRDFKPNNILRSKDGRVMVTDFGLARGLGEDWNSPIAASGSLDPDASRDSGRAPATRDSSRAKDNVLDSPLTKTGALIGTPAYMAPEQFAGAEPDPRTDQFAFCVTAWQALTGARPHFGRTLDELRQAATQGVGAVVTNLPRPMRAVLARGLEPDPAKRWPDMVSLLREVERAGTPPKSRRAWLVAAAAVAIAIPVAVVATREASAPMCEPAETVWADAWTPGKADTPRWLGAVLDDHRAKWLAAYQQTCKAPTPRPDAKLGCLRVVRDRVATVVELAKDPAARAALDPFVLLVPVEACTSKITIAALPDDRARVVSVLTRSAGAPSTPGLEAEAKASGWAAAVPLVAIASGLDRIRSGDVAAGRAQIERALPAADATDTRLTAIARLGMLEASLRELARPDLPGKPDVLHDEIRSQLTYARGAIKAAGDEPVLVGQLELLEGEALLDQAERMPKKLPPTEALVSVTEARKHFDAAGDVRRGALAAARFVEIVFLRGDPELVGEADHIARSAADALERAGLPRLPALDQWIGRIAFARSETTAAHRWFDRVASSPSSITDAVVEGVVVGPDGKPVMNAMVIAWTGELFGDPVRAVTERSTLRGELVETRAEGKFTIHARPGSALIAEASAGTLRTAPIAVKPGMRGLVIKLGTTVEIAGKVDLDQRGPDAYARIAAGASAWVIRVPLQGASFRFTNLPHGRYDLGAIGRSGTGVRRARGGTETATQAPVPVFTNVAWVTGGPIDLVVRGTVAPEATIWVGEAKDLLALAHRETIETYAQTAIEIASSPLLPIGSRYTDAGRPYYVAGARHAVLVGDFKDAAACVAATGEPTAKLVCKRIERDAKALAIDL